MMKFSKTMGRAFLLALLIAASQNTKADVTNGSFEDGFTGWTTGPGLYLMNPIYWTPSQGTNVLEIGGANTSGSYISQTVSVDGGWSYSLSFDYANIGNPGLVSSLAVTVSTTNGVLASNTFNLATHTLTFGTYVPETLNFSVPQGVGSVTITFADQSANNGIAVDPLLDNVALTATGHEFLNGSFEEGFNAWTTGPGLYLMDPIYWTPSHGTNVLEIGGGNVSGSYVSQTFLVTGGTTYDLTFDYSCIGDPDLVASM